MRLSHPEYTKLVFSTYQLLRSSPEFSPNLKQPTPANIRSECLTVYRERPDKKDDPVLRSFFGPAAENNSFLGPIQNFPTERFKALSNYLKGLASTTDDKNVELLAWLIDFRHRPFRLSMDVILNESEKAILNRVEDADENLSQEINREVDAKSENVLGQPLRNEMEIASVLSTFEQVPLFQVNERGYKENSDKKNPISLKLARNKWLLVAAILFFTLVSLAVFSLYDKGDNCMYWTGDHYERVDCDADVTDKVLFNEERWKNFRKITDLSTISEKAIGVVHYYGNKNREFFTSGGKHPVETTRYLKVMTRYIWEKEFGSKDSTSKDTSVNDNK
jgi:hypothetical protein